MSRTRVPAFAMDWSDPSQEWRAQKCKPGVKSGGTELSKTGQKISKKFPKNFQKISKKFPKNSKSFPKNSKKCKKRVR
jgi:hypothetical protein